LSHVTKVYSQGTRSVRALDDLSLQIDAGEFVSIVGPSGCGKTTLLKIAGGLLRPDTGAVTVAGVEPYTLPAEARSRFRGQHVGFVFQQFHLVPYLSVRENILSPVLAWWKGDVHQRAEGLIERFGLSNRKHHRPGELSTGERQRTALARALLHQPKLLLADEPTGNLDPHLAKEIIKLLEKINAQGTTVFVATHDHEMVRSKNKRTVQIADGQIVSSL
ncbi:MAG: ABC transporter ATP-binding protein, partial [Bdellovibrionales bacterium]|nr:ABC transporter ATP-binding protein [Bdellovibrionales bacterium]